MSYFGQLRDQYGFTVENTPTDEMRTVTPIRIVGSTFIGTTLDTNFWTATVLSGGTITTSATVATLKTNTTANGSTVLRSVATARYTGGSANRFRGQIALGDTGATNNTRRWGMFDGTNGAYFALAGTTLSVNTIKAGVITSVASSSWSGTSATPTLTDINSYEIYITNVNVYFVIGGVLVHKASFLLSPWAETTNLPIQIDNINSSNVSTNYELYVRVATIYRLGELKTAPKFKHISTNTTTVCKYGAGTLHSINVNIPTNNNITIYDAVTADANNIIAIMSPGNNTVPFTLTYGASFYNGLTIVTAGSPDLTIIYE